MHALAAIGNEAADSQNKASALLGGLRFTISSKLKLEN
jgi:hypothetical protein